ncbi:MAG: ComEC family competence protein [Bacteroidota bacterium]|nr:ComEC family competence protein [Bacteroidota bacterium]
MKIFSRFPVFRVVIPFSIGILAVIKSNGTLTTMAAFSTIGFVLSVWFTLKNFASGKYAQRWLAGIPFYCCFFGLGGLLTWLHQGVNHRTHFKDFKNSGCFIAQIHSEPVRTKNGYRFIAAISAVQMPEKWQATNGKVVVYLQDTTHSFPGNAGNKLLFAGTVSNIKAPSNPEAFDPGEFYAGQGAWHSVYIPANKYQMLDTPVQKTIFTYARMLRDLMLEKLQRHLGKADLGVAGALLLGYEDWLDPELEGFWQGAGVLHVLCVSGMHVMLIYVILAGMLGWMEKYPLLRHLRYILLMALIWFYAMVTGFSPSVIRAAAMISFVIAGNWINREASIYNLLCSSCMLMFIINPYLLISAGFQLSFLAVCGIIFLHNLILPLWNAPNKFLHKVWELISVSLAAQLSTFPLSLFLFHQFPNYFLIGNLLIIPLSTAVMYSGLLLLVTDWIPYTGIVTGTVTSYGIQALNWLVIAIGNLPGALTENIYLSAFETIILYLLLIFIPVWLVYKSRTWLFTWMLLLTILFSNRIFLNWNAASNEQLTVYDSNGKSITSLLLGRSATVLKDSLTDEKAFKYAAGEHLISSFINTTHHQLLSSGYVTRIQSRLPFTIYIAKDFKKNQRFPGKLTVENKSILILGGHLSVDAGSAIQVLGPVLVIFDSSCKRYQVKKLEEDLRLKGIATFNVAEKGAFQLPANQSSYNFR